MDDSAARRPQTVAEQVAERRRSRSPLRTAGALLAALALVVVLFGSVFVVSGAFQNYGKDEEDRSRAPWAQPGAPDVRPEPRDRQ